MSQYPRLCHIQPRERAGSQTGRKYEYQYERTARATLDLLKDSDGCDCVYCDWHDDYVVETFATVPKYFFHQVKAKKASQGAWTYKEFFGLSLKSATSQNASPSFNPTAIFPNLLLHFANFPDCCQGFFFVTNSEMESSVTKFLDEIQAFDKEVDLPPKSRAQFYHMASSYLHNNPPLITSPSDLFIQIRRLKIHENQGHLEDPEYSLREIADIALEYSEVSLHFRQAKQISREIINEVRRKATHSTTSVPTTEDDLRKDKGITVSGLLRFLSLSAPAFEQLKGGANKETVKTLSRLQRYCQKHNLSHLIEGICSFKAEWDIWRTTQRHFVNNADYVLLQDKAAEVLKRGLAFPQLVEEARDIAVQFSRMATVDLTEKAVLGLIFSSAAESEALDHSGPKGAQNHGA